MKKSKTDEEIEHARKLLGLDECATLAEIKNAFRSMAKKYHPDKSVVYGSEEKQKREEMMKELNEAYETILAFISTYKTCSYDCVYCQLGRTTNKTVERKEYVQNDSVIAELKSLLSTLESPREAIDYITFSGSGEPTLNSAIGVLLREFKAITNVPVAVLTNGSLLYRKDVRDELRNADVVIPSLDAVTEEIFQKVNRPHSSLTVEKVIDGIKEFSKSFNGETWLEIMLVKGINDGQEEIERMAEVAADMNLAKIQLNTVVRPPSEKFALPLNAEEMQQIKEKMGEKAEVIAHFDRKKEKIYKGMIYCFQNFHKPLSRPL